MCIVCRKRIINELLLLKIIDIASILVYVSARLVIQGRSVQDTKYITVKKYLQNKITFAFHEQFDAIKWEQFLWRCRLEQLLHDI